MALMKYKASILAGASISDYKWLASELSESDIVICADSGLRHAMAIDIIPNIIIGDFDSVDQKMLKKYKGKSKIIYDQDQYKTDLMKALDQIPQGHSINVYGAVGERADHDFSNYLILLGRDECNHIVLKTENDERRVIKKPLEIKTNIGDMIGVFPLLPIKTIHYKGLRWPAEGLGPPYKFGWNGACNTAVSNKVIIHIKGGAALITRS
jgi:thiamine pyrophosphokinase